MRKMGTPSLRESVMLGVLTGAGVLIRPTAALLPLVIVMFRWKSGVPFRTNARSLSVVAVIALFVVSPWLARNYAEFHRASLTSNTGVNFWIGNHQGANGSYSYPAKNNPLVHVTDDFERSDLGFKLGTEFILTHPLECLAVEGEKFAHFFSADYWLLTTIEYKPEWAGEQIAGGMFARLSVVNILILHLPVVAVILLGTFGLVCPAVKDERSIFFLRAVVLYWLAAHLIFYADARYRFPIMPLFMLAAAYGWFILIERRYQRRHVRLMTFAVLCLVYIAGWLGEIITLRSKSTSAQPVAERILSDDEFKFVAQSTQGEFSVPNTR